MSQKNNDILPFMKMHGLGNDFVVVDERDGITRINRDVAIAIADRNRGVGFDQLAVITSSLTADAHLTFWNSDGSQAAACGNATRCIARHMMDAINQDALTLSTARGTLQARDLGNGVTSVNMGDPQLSWDEIPLAREMDTLALPIDGAPSATGMGNPHCSFFVEDVMAVDLESRGATLEHHPLFPDRTNVQFVEVTGKDHLRMRVWERGVGVTLASGSSSCAVAVAAARRGLTGPDVTIDLDGGTLQVSWREDGVWMSGPTAHVFDGQWRL